MRLRSALLGAALLALCGPAAQAGILEDLKGAVGEARDLVGDVEETRDEAKGTVTDAKGVVDETAEDVEGVVPRDETVSAPPPPSASAPPPPSARKWHLDAGGGKTREVSEAELVQMIRTGQVRADTYVYGGSLGDWTAAGEVPALSRHFAN